jgi:hypothetical protein
MTINITKGNICRKIVVGDVVKLGRCLVEKLENITEEDIEYIVGIICFVPTSEEYLDIRLGDGLEFDTIKFKKHKNFGSFENTEYYGYMYEIDKENQVYISIL